jgi:hypothetical protein
MNWIKLTNNLKRKKCCLLPENGYRKKGVKETEVQYSLNLK